MVGVEEGRLLFLLQCFIRQVPLNTTPSQIALNLAKQKAGSPSSSSPSSPSSSSSSSTTHSVDSSSSSPQDSVPHNDKTLTELLDTTDVDDWLTSLNIEPPSLQAIQPTTPNWDEQKQIQFQKLLRGRFIALGVVPEKEKQNAS